MVQLTEMPDIGFSFIFDPFDGHDLITHPAFVNSTLSSGCQPFKFTERFRRNLPFVYIKSFVIQVNQPNYNISKWAHTFWIIIILVTFVGFGCQIPKNGPEAAENAIQPSTAWIGQITGGGCHDGQILLTRRPGWRRTNLRLYRRRNCCIWNSRRSVIGHPFEKKKNQISPMINQLSTTTSHTFVTGKPWTSVNTNWDIVQIKTRRCVFSRWP